MSNRLFSGFYWLFVGFSLVLHRVLPWLLKVFSWFSMDFTGFISWISEIDPPRLRLRDLLVRARLLGGLRHGAADGLRGGAAEALRRHRRLGGRAGAEVRLGRGAWEVEMAVDLML